MSLPDGSEEWLDPIFDEVINNVLQSGYFDIVNEHEPKRAPGYGLTASVWIKHISATKIGSGINYTNALVIFNLEVNTNMFEEPQNLIDRKMTKAISNLMRQYHDDFDFNGVIRNIDLLGESGSQLSCDMGYVTIDKKIFRAGVITIPCIVNNVWPQI
jgi:hypothetical protein